MWFPYWRYFSVFILFQLFLGTTYAQDMLLFILVTLAILYKYISRHSDYWQKKNVRGPTPKLFVGNLWDVVTLKVPYSTYLHNLYKSYDDPFVGFFNFDDPALLIRDPELAKTILIKDFNYFQDRVLHQPAHNKVFGNALFNLRNPEWKPIRTRITPVFSSAKLKDMFPLIRSVCEEMVSHMKSIEPEQECRHLIQKLSIEITTQTFFGVQGHCFEKEESEVMKQVNDMIGFTVRNALIQSIYFFKGSLVPIFKFEFLKKEIELFFKNMFWTSLKHVQESETKRNNYISLLDDLRKKDPLFGKHNLLN